MPHLQSYMTTLPFFPRPAKVSRFSFRSRWIVCSFILALGLRSTADAATEGTALGDAARTKLVAVVRTGEAALRVAEARGGILDIELDVGAVVQHFLQVGRTDVG